MDVLEKVIENLTSDEVRRFKILSNRFKADEEKKLIVLFDAIRAGNFKENEDDVIRELYEKISSRTKNSYYRLRNKLLTNLEKSLLFYHFNYRNTLESHSHIQVATLLREKGLFREAYYYLRKAEKNAIHFDQFSVLEVIYDEMVQLAAREVKIDIESVFEKRRANLEKMEVQRKTTEILGMISQQANRLSISRGRRGESLTELLEQARQQLEEYQDMFNSTSGRILVARTVCLILLKRGGYRDLEKYIQKTFRQFGENKDFDRTNHPFKLRMRIWWINTVRKLHKFEEEKQHVDQLEKDLKAYKGQYYNEFAIFYFTSRATNEKLRGNLEAAQAALDGGWKTKSIIQNDFNRMILAISQADQYFNVEDYEAAYETLNDITSNKAFSELDEAVKLYVEIFAQVVGYEAGKYNKVKSRYDKIRKTYRKLLGDSEYSKAQRFLSIVMRLNNATKDQRGIDLETACRNFLKEYPPSEVADNEIIMYEEYLKAKVAGRPYYDQLMDTLS